MKSAARLGFHCPSQLKVGDAGGHEQRHKETVSYMCFICFIHSSNDRRKKGIIETKKLRRVLSFQCINNLSYKPTFCMLQHKKYRLLGNDVLVQAHHVGHTAGDDGLSVPAAFAAFP